MKNQMTSAIMGLLDSLDSSALIETIERGIDIQKLEIELHPEKARDIQRRIADSCILLTCIRANRLFSNQQ